MSIATDSTSFGQMMKSAKVPGTRSPGRVEIEKPAAKIPAGKRVLGQAKQLAMARQAVQRGEIQPSVRQIKALCQCGAARAQAIRATLESEGVAKINSSGELAAT